MHGERTAVAASHRRRLWTWTAVVTLGLLLMAAAAVLWLPGDPAVDRLLARVRLGLGAGLLVGFLIGALVARRRQAHRQANASVLGAAGSALHVVETLWTGAPEPVHLVLFVAGMAGLLGAVFLLIRASPPVPR